MKLFLLLVVLVFSRTAAQAQATNQAATDTIPLGGNAWVAEPAQITDAGLTHWSSNAAGPAIYFRTEVAQTVRVWLRLRVASGTSTISLAANGVQLTKKVTNTEFQIVAMGELPISKPGYVKLTLQGLSKSGAVYADVADLLVQPTKPGSNLVYVKRGSSFHFGRRGPSVHLNYVVPAELTNNVHWFYSEIVVPVGMDKIGSYFEADGFGEGYFGMQVNSPTERRILFSVWSSFKTDSPQAIPDSARVLLLTKGAAVQANSFGNEGSGGQSFMRFNWAAGKAYGFLLHAEPDKATSTTTYTAYFKDVSADKWYLIASFKRPQTVTGLKHLYSFLENFMPEMGATSRLGFYQNQWVADENTAWHELTEAKFTVDATARGGYRKDYAGGVADGKFFLKDGGFFDSYTAPNQVFKRPASQKKPDLRGLPK